jgi:hypothetical protein
MRICSYVIVLQLSLLLWGSAYYAGREIYKNLDASRTFDTFFIAQENSAER